MFMIDDNLTPIFLDLLFDIFWKFIDYKKCYDNLLIIS